LYNLAVNAHEQGDLALADSIYPRALAMMRDVHVQPDRRTARAMSDYGLAQVHMNRLLDAETMLLQSRSALRSIHQGLHPERGEVLVRLGRLRLSQGRPSDADSLALASLRHFRTETDTAAAGLLSARLLGARAALTLGELSRSHALQNEAASHLESLPRSETWQRYRLQTIRGKIALARDSIGRAKQILGETHSALRATLGTGNAHTVAAHDALQAARKREQQVLGSRDLHR